MSAAMQLVVAYLGSAVLSATSAIALFRRRKSSPGAGAFANVLAFETCWTLAGIAELQSPTLGGKLFWDDAQLLPSLFVPIELLFFALAYVGRLPAHPGRTRWLASIVPLVCAAYVFTDPWHHGARAGARIAASEPFDVLIYEFTPVENVAFAYTYGLIAIVTMLLVRRILEEHRIFRVQTGVALFAMLLPSAASVLMLFDVRVFGQRDFTPLVFGVSGVIIASALGRRRFFDLVPIARDAVVESVSDAVILLDARCRFVDVNAAARSLLDRPLDELLGRDAVELLPCFDTMLDARSSGSGSPIELEMSTPRGRRTFEALVSEVVDAPGSVLGTAILLRDVTDRRLAEDALRQAKLALEDRVLERTRQLSEANEALSEANRSLTLEMAERLLAERAQSELELQLQASQKMESIGRLAGGVAHDFNNLLTAIICNVDLIGRKTRHDPKLTELLDPVRRASESASGLTRQLLAFSRNQIVEPKPLDVDASIEKVLQMLARIIGEDVELRFEPCSDGAYLLCDPGHLEQVLMNLTVNARDAMGIGGSIVLRTEQITLEQPKACADATELRPGTYVSVAVSDSGSGIAPEILAKMFDPFFTTKAEGRGTGLGLAVVRDLVRQHGGSIDVATTPCVGTTFTVYFPSIEAPAHVSSEESAIADPPGGSEHILLVEDQTLVREAIARTLERLGYRVLACDTAQHGLGVIERCPESVDLLLTDVVLADGSGRRLAESARAHAPNLGVLYVSGYTDDVVLRHGIAQGDVRYLAKPFTERQLAVAVRRALDHRTMS